MEHAFYLRFVGAAVATSLVVLVTSTVLGAGAPGVVDGLFLTGVLAAAVAALFTRPAVFRKRSIRRAKEENDEDVPDDYPESVVREERAADREESATDGEDDGSGRAVSGRRTRSIREDDTDDANPARKIRIGIGLVAYATVLLTLSALVHFLAV